MAHHLWAGEHGGDGAGDRAWLGGQRHELSTHVVCRRLLWSERNDDHVRASAANADKQPHDAQLPPAVVLVMDVASSFVLLSVTGEAISEGASALSM